MSEAALRKDATLRVWLGAEEAAWPEENSGRAPGQAFGQPPSGGVGAARLLRGA